MGGMYKSIIRIYKLNIPNIFYWSPKLTLPRFISCHLRWLASIIPFKWTKSGLYKIAFFFEKICYSQVKHHLKKALSKEFSEISMNYQERQVKNQTVWYSWWQGMDNAPNVVKNCIKQMQKQLPQGTKFINIDQTNFKEYVSLRPEILDLFLSEKMTNAQFSDQIRVNLLAMHGGIWVDATLWLNKEFTNDIFNYPFLSYRAKKSLPIASDHGISQGNWQLYFLGGTNTYFYEALKVLNDAYWQRYTKVIHYLQLDNLIDLALDCLPELAKEMKKLPVHSHDPGDFLAGGYKYQLADKATTAIMTDVNIDFDLIKLSWKFEPPKEIDGYLTVYGELINTQD